MEKEGMPNENVQEMLERMEANERFRFAEKNPRFKKLEKEIPLHINCLGLGRNRISINSTSYRLRIIRHYPHGPPLEHHKRDDLNGGIYYDLDVFGQFDQTADSIIFPGDISIPRAEMPMNDWPKHMENERELYKDQIEKDKRLLERLNILYRIGRDNTVKTEIEELKAKIHFWISRVYCNQPPFDIYIKYSKIENGVEESINLGSGQKLYEAQKDLFDRLLGERPTITVNRLSVHGNSGVLRLPPGLQLQIQELKTAGNLSSLISAISSFVDFTQLQKYIILAGPDFGDPENHEHNILKTVKSVEFVNMNAETNTSYWFDILLKNENLHLSLRNKEFTALHILYITDFWIERKRTIGTTAKIFIREKSTIQELFEILKTRRNVKYTTISESREFPEKFRLPVDLSSEFCVECDRSTEKRKPRLFIYMEVQATQKPEEP
ncbi:hypothetical protein CAEBREN_06647 [Caenorhabditis brenneri]|uniref:Uncharacterized protein n=1 Tax=Caenorhabditis brenneri TaxID=135651 RepID=G0NWE2_CAEBE|nr:hypothetical protein CAEBREN_06647 [Caenorhabditis brenneri]